MAWLERSIENHWGVTKYMKVAGEKLPLAPDCLPCKLVIVLGPLWPYLCLYVYWMVLHWMVTFEGFPPVSSAELFNNLGLCCFYAQQYDMTLACMERAIALTTDDTEADMW